ncbi:unnamed protein product [Ambrosiozyma monospora]|uniref:Unnamed protein product n=1 Tax=Ambrosiozyma monospora TaxID=43982 RepID=A0ACB5TFE1_AMBMO|nr:unnamed protein product [Ambrosiozyma monospora]
MKLNSLLISLVSTASLVTAGFYDNTKNIYELNPSNFDDVVLKTNHTTVVEFYAPWCKYCILMKGHYKRAARVASDYATFGAVNCDKDENKPLCAKYHVEGFPTVMSFRPPKVNLDDYDEKKMKHSAEVYRGKREAKPLVEFLQGRIKNYVKRLNSLKLEKFLRVQDGQRDRVLLLTNKNSLSPVFKGLAIDYLGVYDFAYFPVNDDNRVLVSSKITVLDDDFDLPRIVLVTKDEIILFHGDVKSKSSISEFLSGYKQPVEGEFSVKGKALKAINSGRAKNFRDFFKKQKKQQLVKDEL